MICCHLFGALSYDDMSYVPHFILSLDHNDDYGDDVHDVDDMT